MGLVQVAGPTLRAMGRTGLAPNTDTINTLMQVSGCVNTGSSAARTQNLHRAACCLSWTPEPWSPATAHCVKAPCQAHGNSLAGPGPRPQPPTSGHPLMAGQCWGIHPCPGWCRRLCSRGPPGWCPACSGLCCGQSCCRTRCPTPTSSPRSPSWAVILTRWAPLC